MTSTIGSTYTPDVQRYIIQASDVLSDHRLTVSPLADPSTVIWYTERYIAQSASGPPEIVENIVHQPTNTVCWTVHRPTSIRRQGWYVRMRSPLFPPGVFIPMKPVSSTSPYYVDGALSFKCRTNDVSKPPPPPPLLRNPSQPRDRTSMSSTSSASSSSSGSVKHSYPPTPTSSPPPTATRPNLPPLRVPSSVASKGRFLTKDSDDSVYVIGLDDGDDDQAESQTPTASKTPTVATSVRPPSIVLNGSTRDVEASKRPLSLSNGKARELPQTQHSPNHLNPTQPNAHPRRGPPLTIPLSHISEFIIVPLSETANASSGPFANLTSTPSGLSSPATSPVTYPHSHQRTVSRTLNLNGAQTLAQPASQSTQNRGILSKAVNLLKASIPTTISNTWNSTMQGNSFTITLVPDTPRLQSETPTSGASNLGGVGSLPPPYTSSANLLNGSTASLNDYHSPAASTSSIPTHTGASSVSSSLFVQPLPPPLLSFTDQTSMFPITIGFNGLFKGQGPIPPTAPNRSHARASLQPSPRHANQATPTHSASTSLPFQLMSPSSAGSSQGAAPRAPSPNPNYTTLGTLTVSRSQLEHLGVDMAFWVACALVFWGYLEDRDGYLSAMDD